MDDIPAKLTEVQQSRIWDAFKQLDHKRRNKQIGWNQCIREAYLACARELPPETAVALVVHYGQKLTWLTSRPVAGLSGALRA